MNNVLFVLSPTSLTDSSTFVSRSVVHSHQQRHAPVVRRSRHAFPKMAQATDERASAVVRGPFDGVYGRWNLTQGDVDGVNIYRSALLVSAISAAAGIGLYHTSLTENTLLTDALFAIHTAAFGVALSTIHIYVKPLHQMLKVLFASSLVGAAAIFATNFSIVNAVVENPVYLLAVGWQFVALTGLFFKESICFGRVEALGLTLLTPVIVGGHFLGVLDPGFVDSALTAYAAIYLFFAGRKFTQLPEADCGDLSVFQHMAKMGK